LWPGDGVLNAYSGSTANQLNDALGVYLITWFIVTFLFLWVLYLLEAALQLRNVY